MPQYFLLAAAFHGSNYTNNGLISTMIEPPADKQIIKGEIADYWFEDGILISLLKSIKRTVDAISGNVALVNSITNNKPLLLLIYLAPFHVPDKDNRKFAADELPF